jgi:alkanesulfonate monooxygenase
MLPQYLLAGQSAGAVQVAEKIGAVNIQMLGPRLEAQVAAQAVAAKAIHFGLVVRESDERAWQAAHQRFPEDKVGQFVLGESMKNTDSQWKRRLQMAAAQESADARPGFWMMPFRNFQADCPYFIGSHERAAELVAGLVRAGVHTFVLDIPLDEEEFENTARAFDRASRLLVA